MPVSFGGTPVYIQKRSPLSGITQGLTAGADVGTKIAQVQLARKQQSLDAFNKLYDQAEQGMGFHNFLQRNQGVARKYYEDFVQNKGFLDKFDEEGFNKWLQQPDDYQSQLRAEVGQTASEFKDIGTKPLVQDPVTPAVPFKETSRQEALAQTPGAVEQTNQRLHLGEVRDTARRLGVKVPREDTMGIAKMVEPGEYKLTRESTYDLSSVIQAVRDSDYPPDVKQHLLSAARARSDVYTTAQRVFDLEDRLARTTNEDEKRALDATQKQLLKTFEDQLSLTNSWMNAAHTEILRTQLPTDARGAVNQQFDQAAETGPSQVDPAMAAFDRPRVPEMPDPQTRLQQLQQFGEQGLGAFSQGVAAPEGLAGQASAAQTGLTQARTGQVPAETGLTRAQTRLTDVQADLAPFIAETQRLNAMANLGRANPSQVANTLLSTRQKFLNTFTQPDGKIDTNARNEFLSRERALLDAFQNVAPKGWFWKPKDEKMKTGWGELLKNSPDLANAAQMYANDLQSRGLPVEFITHDGKTYPLPFFATEEELNTATTDPLTSEEFQAGLQFLQNRGF